MEYKTLTLIAPSKINLGLDVVRRLPNGYHEVRMIMQTLDLHDTLTLTTNESGQITLKCNVPGIPTGAENLICKAGRLLMDEFGITQGLHVILDKQIPVAAGMAGGSTDAAAMMVGVNQLFQLKLSQQQLMDRAVRIGADVPYCIMQGTALAEGIGEKLSRLKPMIPCPVLIAKPPIDVSTKFVYTHLVLDETTSHPPIDAMISDLDAADLKGVASHLGNVLESVTVPAYPVISQIKELMLADGALNSMMSGSGPTVFGLFDDEALAQKAYEHMKASGLAGQVFLTGIRNSNEI